jgi:hypothetical protein
LADLGGRHPGPPEELRRHVTFRLAPRTASVYNQLLPKGKRTEAAEKLLEGGAKIYYLARDSGPHIGGSESGSNEIPMNEAAAKFVQKYGDFAVKQINRLRRLMKNYPQLTYEINPNQPWIKYWMPCKFDPTELPHKAKPSQIEEGTGQFCSTAHEAAWRIANDHAFAERFHRAGAKASARANKKDRIQTRCLYCNKWLSYRKRKGLPLWRWGDERVKKYGAPEFCSAKCRALYRRDHGSLEFHSAKSRRKAAKARDTRRPLYCESCGREIKSNRFPHGFPRYYWDPEHPEHRKRFCEDCDRLRRVKMLTSKKWRMRQSRRMKKNPHPRDPATGQWAA